ncbi:hypothetical protein [Streptomyces sp. URMC 129]|uniref:hypothetical protein n=1 Tax=Streptomyces sp. URMC 129 TaxID=3423407 RepID=UPI003F1980EF
MATMVRPTENITTETAKERLIRHHQHLEKRYAKLESIRKKVYAGDDLYGIAGGVEFDAYLIYGELNVTAFWENDGSEVTYSGTAWGAGFGGFAGIGQGMYAYSAADTRGTSLSFSILAAAEEAGAVTITWWDGGTPVGTMLVGGVGDIGAGMYGSGSWN